MQKGARVFILLSLVPGLIETFREREFAITIPGFPISVGSSLFVFVGVLLIIQRGSPFFKNDIFIGLALIFIGCVFGALFSENVGDGISRGLAQVFLLVAACGVAGLWDEK